MGRLALAPAAGLLEAALRLGRAVPDQKTLDAYLRKVPGQRTAVSGFVAHLRDGNGAKIAVPRRDPQAARRKRRWMLRIELLELMRENESGAAAKRRWIVVALLYFHDVARNVGNVHPHEDSPRSHTNSTVVLTNSQ